MRRGEGAESLRGRRGATPVRQRQAPSDEPARLGLSSLPARRREHAAVPADDVPLAIHLPVPLCCRTGNRRHQVALGQNS